MSCCQAQGISHCAARPHPECTPLQELLGDTGTRRVLRAAVGRLVCMRQHEQMSVAQAIPGLRTSALPFLPASSPRDGDLPCLTLRCTWENSLRLSCERRRLSAIAFSAQLFWPRGRLPNVVLLPLSGKAGTAAREPASQQAARQRMAVLWVAWLLGSLVVPLLRAHFFATETAAYRLQIFYYRSPPSSCCRFLTQTM